MKKLITLFSLLLFFTLNVFATTYYSVSSSALNTVGNWKTNRDGTGTSPANLTTANDIFIIQGTGNGGTSPHAMTLGTTLTIGSGSSNTKLQIENGASLTANSALTIGSAATFQIDGGGTYTHNHTGAFATAIFGGTESFAPNSNFIVSGVVGTGPTALTVAGGFGNFTYSGTGTMQCNGVMPNVAGNLTMNGSGEFRLAASSPATYILNIGGDLNIQSGIFSYGNNAAVGTINLSGNFNMSGGIFQTASNSGTAIANAICTLNFNKAGTQTFTKTGGTITATTSGFRRISVFVLNGTTLDMGTSALNCNVSSNVDFTVNAGATLKIGSPDGIIVAGTTATTGNIQTSATSIRSFSTAANYAYTGIAAQVTGTGLPSTVDSLIVKNAAGVTLTGAVTITKALIDSVGTLTTAANNITLGAASTATFLPATTLNIDNAAAIVDFASRPVVFESAITGTARIANVVGTLINASNVTLQRFILGTHRAYRFLGNPFSSAIPLSQYADDIDITSTTGVGGGFANGSSSNSSFYYNTATGNGSTTSDPGWTPYTSTATTIDAGDGFRVFIRGSKGQSGIFTAPYPTPGNNTISVTGSLNDTASFVKNLAIGASSGYNFISNPFASNVNIKTLTLGGAVNNNYWIWNANLGTSGGYLAYSFGVDDYALPTLGGFIVNATGSGQSITFTGADKTTSDTSLMLKHNLNVGVGTVEMSVNVDNNMYDRFRLFLGKKGSNKGTDIAYDGAKFFNLEANLYSFNADNKALSVDVRPFDANDVIPMGFTSNKPRTYKFIVENINLDYEIPLFLNDKYLDIQIKLEKGTTYEFTVNANAASQGDNRFELTYTPKPIRKNITTANIILVPNPTTDNVNVTFSNKEKVATSITLTTNDGRVVKTINAGIVKEGKLNIVTKGLAKGLYNVTVQTGADKTTQKLQIQ